MIEFIIVLVVAIALVVFIRSFSYTPVQSNSCDNTVNPELPVVVPQMQATPKPVAKKKTAKKVVSKKK